MKRRCQTFLANLQITFSKVRQEVKFLEKFEAPEKFKKLKKEHISCSNLSHQVNQCALESLIPDMSCGAAGQLLGN